MNPWLTIPLTDYESHMSHETVCQDALLADVLGDAVDESRPASVCIVGCAGGNGLDRLDESCAICATDINQDYVDVARSRFSDGFRRADFLVHDIESSPVPSGPYELVFCGLVLEYVDLTRAVPNVALSAADGGRIVLVLQGKSSQPKVSSTSVNSLNRLASIMSLLEPGAIEEIFSQEGCRVDGIRTLHSVSDKPFHVMTLTRKARR